MNVFVSSSWRNERQPAVVQALRAAGHHVYDFRNPAPVSPVKGFSWAEIDPSWQKWTAVQFREGLRHPRARAGYMLDITALRECDALVMVQPCGRSAALELGWAAGAGKPTLVLLADSEPELMLSMAGHFCLDVDEVVEALAKIERGKAGE